MKTINFTKRNMSKTPLIAGYNSRVVIDVSDDVSPQFPEQFYLKSPLSGVTVIMHHLDDETFAYCAENEGWDGEYNAHLYGGMTPKGKTVLVELYTTPNL